jgi:predicted nucleic acid-binding protein
MNASDAFFDTNVLLYLISGDATKATRAEHLMGEGGVISVQVLTEFTDVASRKYGSPLIRVYEVLSIIRDICDVQNVTVETYELGWSLAHRHRFRIFDGMIIAAAILADCRTLFSEDMQHGQRIQRIEIRNPFFTH